MNLCEIPWHDSLILNVKIVPERDLLEMRLLYPEEARHQTFAEHTIVFEDAYGYKEFEGPFQGSPTILDISVVGQHDRWSQLRIDTNAGYREVFCCDVYRKSR